MLWQVLALALVVDGDLDYLPASVDRQTMELQEQTDEMRRHNEEMERIARERPVAAAAPQPSVAAREQAPVPVDVALVLRTAGESMGYFRSSVRKLDQRFRTAWLWWQMPSGPSQDFVIVDCKRMALDFSASERPGRLAEPATPTEGTALRAVADAVCGRKRGQ